MSNAIRNISEDNDNGRIWLKRINYDRDLRSIFFRDGNTSSERLVKYQHPELLNNDMIHRDFFLPSFKNVAIRCERDLPVQRWSSTGLEERWRSSEGQLWRIEPDSRKMAFEKALLFFHSHSFFARAISEKPLTTHRLVSRLLAVINPGALLKPAKVYKQRNEKQIRRFLFSILYPKTKITVSAENAHIYSKHQSVIAKDKSYSETNYGVLWRKSTEFLKTLNEIVDDTKKRTRYFRRFFRSEIEKIEHKTPYETEILSKPVTARDASHGPEQFWKRFTSKSGSSDHDADNHRKFPPKSMFFREVVMG